MEWNQSGDSEYTDQENMDGIRALSMHYMRKEDPKTNVFTTLSDFVDGGFVVVHALMSMIMRLLLSIVFH